MPESEDIDGVTVARRDGFVVVTYGEVRMGGVRELHLDPASAVSLGSALMAHGNGAADD